jgi:hypothetical protein
MLNIKCWLITLHVYNRLQAYYANHLILVKTCLKVIKGSSLCLWVLYSVEALHVYGVTAWSWWGRLAECSLSSFALYPSLCAGDLLPLQAMTTMAISGRFRPLMAGLCTGTHPRLRVYRGRYSPLGWGECTWHLRESLPLKTCSIFWSTFGFSFCKHEPKM